MAAVDQRLGAERVGAVRRGATPAAPKPINLPSQKFENHRLVPDVEIVPRGTCCWGSAGRSIAASGSSNDKTDSASPPLGINGTEDLGSKVQNGTEDHGSKVQNDSVLTDEVPSSAENSDEVYCAESSTSPTSLSACNTSTESCNACPNLGVGNISTTEGSDSPAASDAGTFPEIVARPSSSESYLTSLASPTTGVEEPKQFSGFSQVCSGDNEKVSNGQAKQDTHAGNESSLGSQDFGYFEGFYNTQSPFSRPGVPYPNGPGMAFGPGMHPDPPHHYSFLGVPYYDSVKDKEIVVITMVGNPGVYGNYLPYPGFPNQSGGPSVYGNLPLQFGHFEHCVGPQVFAEMNPMCPGEDSGYVSYEQENYKQDWSYGSPVGNRRRNNRVHFPTSLSPFELNNDDCNMPKRTGRQKAVNRNRRPNREASPLPERRVTLLTKVSQHEVIISNMKRKSKHGGARRAKNTCSPHVSPEDAIEVAQNSMGIPVCASQANKFIAPVEASTGDMVHAQYGASHSTIGRTALVSTAAAPVGEVNAETSCAADRSEVVSEHDFSALEAACRGYNIEDSISEAGCEEAAKAAVFEPISIPSPMSTSTPTPVPTSQTSNGSSVDHGSPHQGLPPTCSPTILYQVPGCSVETFNGSADNTRFKSEVRCVSKVGEIWLDCPCNTLTESEVSMEPAFECTNDNETLSAAAAACLTNEHMEESPRKLLVQKSNKKWRRKGHVDVTKLEHAGFSQKTKDLGVDERASCHERASDIPRDVKHTAGSCSLQSSPRKVKPLSEGRVPLCYGASAALDESAAFSKNGQVTVSLVDTGDELCKDNRSKGAEAGSPITGGFEHADQLLDSSMMTSSAAGGQSLHSRIASCGAGKMWSPGSPTAGGFECEDQHLDSSMKTSTAAGGQSSHSRIVSCVVGRMWRPKLSGAAGGHNSSVKKGSGVKPGKVAAAPNVSGFQVKENGSVSDCTCLKHTLEVLCEDYGKDDNKEQLKAGVDCTNEQIEGCNKLAITAASVSKVPCDKRERPYQELNHNVDSVQDVQGNGGSKLSQKVQKQRRSENLYLTHGIETNLERSRNVVVEFNSRKHSSPRKTNIGKQGNAWRVVGKEMPQQKVSKLEPEPEQNNSVVKSKEPVNFVQGVFWKPKQSCAVKKGSCSGVEDEASNVALRNALSAEGKEQGNRRPFSMKNFLNDDNRKATGLQQSLSHSSAEMEHGTVRENMYTAGIGHGQSHSSGRSNHMKVERRGEFHAAKKVDKKGWVVKSETAHSKA